MEKKTNEKVIAPGTETVDIDSFFKVIGKHAYFRDRAEEKGFHLLKENEELKNENVQLTKANDELQKLLKAQAEPK